MGQGASQPERRTDSGNRLSRRASVFRRSVHMPLGEEGQQDGLLGGQHSPEHRTSRPRARPASINRLSQLLHMDSSNVLPADGESSDRPRASGMLQRTRSTFRDMLSHRERSHIRTRDISGPTPRFLQHRTSYVRSGMNGEDADYYPPRLPSIDLTSSFDHEPFPPSEIEAPAPRSSGSNRRSNLRLTSLRPDRPFRHFPSLRRRRSPQPAIRRLGGAEDQAAMLSRLLSVAAAATAATLMGDDHHALSEARSLTGGAGIGDIGGAGEDGSFDGFLRALQNGRIASALRGGGDVEPDSGGGPPGPLNFFRMFRFGASTSTAGDRNRSAEGGSRGSDGENNDAEGRMVPIIIVGIRSISPNSGPNPGSNNAEDLPPFIDALGSFPSPLPTHALGTHGHDSIDSILRPPQNGTSFRHRRRASMGGFGIGRSRLSDRMDDQRDHRSPDRRRERPWSMASSSSALEPRPPPATPASPSPELSRISSRNSTPAHSRPASFVANSTRDFNGDSRRNSILHRGSAASPLSSHTEETVSLHSAHSSTNLLSQGSEPFRHPHRRSDTVPNIHYPRFASGHPRRNGVVEPDHLPPLSRSSTSAGTESSNNERRNSNNDSRSWIIYVLGGSYPENHPILTTPSLFTENPTYEDMMLLSALLGPAKAPVATEEDVESAGGIYEIKTLEEEPVADAAKTAVLVAAATESDERIPIEPSQRCLVCLCDFEIKETARKLVKCNHLFHKECIDQWLTQGRNSCPLCRGQGVDEKEKPADASSESESPNASAGASSESVEPVELEASS
ncbi:hypothetical protein LTR37_019075 [Vermiconidia calcicola]|uniref:Uncharacterized protein n=1 Tax=Vermiconidia calcicola TaxID=1690605 RepID=A0ACC3MFB9_9PEZI|nr:hypothetical protein LTR37_019075 [Vermiconidia calcicola]